MTDLPRDNPPTHALLQIKGNCPRSLIAAIVLRLYGPGLVPPGLLASDSTGGIVAQVLCTSAQLLGLYQELGHFPPPFHVLVHPLDWDQAQELLQRDITESVDNIAKVPRKIADFSPAIGNRRNKG